MLNITLNISSQKWLVVGGGQVATRRTKKILAANGAVKVISPVVSKELEKIAKRTNKIKILRRAYKYTDVRGMSFIVACTNDKETNKKVVADSRKMKIFVSNASDDQDSDFSFTSNFKLNKDVEISFSTGGKSPFFSKVARILFEKNLKKDLLKLYKFLKDVRKSNLNYQELTSKIIDSGLLKKFEYTNEKNIDKIIKRLNREKTTHE
tara:strand:+ start:963 stop:1586 length:624 start_codon:yes stop_codon:yes gene_type:complete